MRERRENTIKALTFLSRVMEASIEDMRRIDPLLSVLSVDSLVGRSLQERSNQKSKPWVIIDNQYSGCSHTPILRSRRKLQMLNPN